MRDPFRIGVALRFTKTWRASHSLIHTNVVMKKSLTGAVSISNTFTLYAVSFRVPFSLYTVGFRIPSVLLFLRPVFYKHLTLPSAIWNNDWWHITFRLSIIYNWYFVPISCPLLHISVSCFYTDGLWSTFPSVVMYIFWPGGKIISGLPWAVAHLMLWTRGEFLLAANLTRPRFVSHACSFRI